MCLHACAAPVVSFLSSYNRACQKVAFKVWAPLRGTTEEGSVSSDAEDVPSAMAVDSDEEQGTSVEGCMAAFFQPEPVQWDCECGAEGPSGSEAGAREGRSALRSSSVRVDFICFSMC